DLYRKWRYRPDCDRSIRRGGCHAREIRNLSRTIPGLRPQPVGTRDGTARVSMIPAGEEFILGEDRGKERLLQAVRELSEAVALAVPHDEALRIRDAVGFFQAVRAALVKHISDDRKPPLVLDHAIRQIVSKALVSDEIVDIFAAAAGHFD